MCMSWTRNICYYFISVICFCNNVNHQLPTLVSALPRLPPYWDVYVNERYRTINLEYIVYGWNQIYSLYPQYLPWVIFYISEKCERKQESEKEKETYIN